MEKNDDMVGTLGNFSLKKSSLISLNELHPISLTL